MTIETDDAVETFDIELAADVLVIGGGPAGAWAALSASDEGASVVIVEKGYLGTSGPFAVGSGTGAYHARPDDPEQRETIVQSRQPIAYGLSDPAWGYRAYDQSYINLDKMAKWGYEWPRTSDGKFEQRGSMYGPTIMAFLRKIMVQHGVTILDHSPALELLKTEDGLAAGATGVNKQTGETWRVRAGAVVVTTGGTTFLSGALGDKGHTGDGYLLAAELGAEFSGMEFNGQFHVAVGGTYLTRGGYHGGSGTYRDNSGKETFIGRRMVDSILETGGVWETLDRVADDPVAQDLLRGTNPILFAYFDRKGIDPFREGHPVDFILEGSLRAGGGIAIDDDLATSVPGLFAGGDVTSREKLTGGGPPGGGPASAWALATGAFAGQSAAKFALSHGEHLQTRKVVPGGRFGVQQVKDREISPDEIIEIVRDEMLPLDKNYWRTGDKMTASLKRFEDAWTNAIPRLGWLARETAKLTARDRLRTREAVSLLAAGRWMYASANLRTESRGLHRRKDFPGFSEEWEGQHIISGGLDEVWTKKVAHVNTLGDKLALASA
jgi:succinate dehydrogenase/fumarate reductase flavoprotein subunit